MQVAVRRMRSDEWFTARSVTIDAFDDPHIGELLDGLRESWAWEADLSFVALVDDEIVGHVLLTHAILDAPQRLTAAFMVHPLRSYEPSMRGALVYPDVFWRLAAVGLRE